MGAAFVYMYFVGFGASLGVLSSVGIGWKIYNRSKNKTVKRKGAIV